MIAIAMLLHSVDVALVTKRHIIFANITYSYPCGLCSL